MEVDALVGAGDGVTRTLDSEVLICWSEILPYLGDGIPEATELIAGRGIGFATSPVQRDIPESALSTHGETLALHYAERIRSSVPSHYVVTYQVNKLIGIPRNSLGEAGVHVLVQAATEKGFAIGSGGE